LRFEAQTNLQINQKPGEQPAAAEPRFTTTQGQYMAFIWAYSRIFKQPPAEADMQRHFEVTAPSVHQMVLTLERAGLITRQSGAAPSIQIIVAPEALPILH
jgi:DNA-binding MarR family transcriptional regulator